MNKSNMTLIAGFMVLVVIDFFANSWVSVGNNNKSLSVESWDQSVLKKESPLSLPEINQYFGLKPKVDEEAERLKAEQEELLAKELAEQEKVQKVITLDAGDLKLFGITQLGDEKVALISISGLGIGNDVLLLKKDTDMSIGDGGYTIQIEEIKETSVRIVVKSSDTKATQIYSLAMFNYDL